MKEYFGPDWLFLNKAGLCTLPYLTLPYSIPLLRQSEQSAFELYSCIIIIVIPYFD